MLNIAVRAARRAGNVILRGQARLPEFGYETKGPHDYVSEIDREAESIIIDTLTTAYPQHAILAEESGSIGQSDHLWVVHPLDGAMNYLHSYPQFAVSIGLRVRGRLDQAVVFDPMRNELFTASRGMGAQLNGRRTRVATQRNIDHALLATGFPVRSPLELRARMPMFNDMLAHCADIRRAGAAALDLAYVACGRLDGFWEFNLKPWDVTAGALLVQESGGLVGDPDGSQSHLESGDIVAANPKLFRHIVSRLSRHRTPPATR